jgi:uncharacterized protein (DUF488 family)
MSDVVSEHPAAVCFANDPVMCNRGGLELCFFADTNASIPHIFAPQKHARS